MDVSLADLSNQLGDLSFLVNVRLNEVERLVRMATQAQVDALTTQLTAIRDQVASLGTTLTADDAAIAAAIEALKNAHPDIDVTALEAAVQSAQESVTTLAQAVDATTALVPPATP